MAKSVVKIKKEGNGLRERALRAIDGKLSESTNKSVLEVKELLHELHVHQIELELQNEELSHARGQLEQSRNQYQNLYERAPIGYFSLDKEGIVRNVNLMGEALLHVNKGILKGKAFQYFVSQPDKEVFHTFLRKVFSTSEKQSCEVKITTQNKKVFFALIEGAVVENTEAENTEAENSAAENIFSFGECLMAVIDISEQKKAQKIISTSIEEKERLNIIIATQEEERRRISESLHNSIAQLLYAAQLKLEMLMDSEKNSHPFVQQIHDLIQNSVNETRTISFELMPSILRDFGLKATLQELCKKKGSGNLEISYTFPGKETRIDNFIEIAVYRIVQELINNIIKHSKATKARVYCELASKFVRIQVEDNGTGFNPDPGIDSLEKMGLRNIKNRVKLMNGDLTINPVPGKGTKINIEIPFL